MFERRLHPRAPTLQTGKVFTGDALPAIACEILNINEGGACILVPNAAEIPKTFTLLLDRTNTTHSCEMVWTARNRIGLAFQSTNAKRR
jgi:hypothetical protein